MFRAVLLSVLVLLAVAPAARAELRVIDTTTGASRTLLKADSSTGEASLVRWTDDGSALLADPRGSVLRVGVADRSVTHLSALDEAASIGPGLRYLEPVYVSRRGETYTLRRADGAQVGVYHLGESEDDAAIRGHPTADRSPSGSRRS